MHALAQHSSRTPEMSRNINECKNEDVDFVTIRCRAEEKLVVKNQVKCQQLKCGKNLEENQMLFCYTYYVFSVCAYKN